MSAEVMMSRAPEVLFVIFAVLMLLSALGVLYAKNQVNAAMSLVASFFFLAAIYALLYAHTLAVLQILVYAGAIMVLFLFVIMLLSLQDTPGQGLEITPWKVVAIAAALVVTAATLHTVEIGGVQTTVTSVSSSERTATFAATPFTRALYAKPGSSLGEVETASGKVLEVQGVIPGRVGGVITHQLQDVSGLKTGDPVTLRWSVAEVTRPFGTVAELGAVMFSRYLLPFEVTSLLLLVAIVGAVVVAKGKI